MHLPARHGKPGGRAGGVYAVRPRSLRTPSAPALAVLFCIAHTSSAVVITLLHPHAGPAMVSAA